MTLPGIGGYGQVLSQPVEHAARTDVGKPNLASFHVPKT